MKIVIVLPLLFGMIAGRAQTVINKTVPVTAGQKIEMHFDYPKIIRVSTWNKNEISIQGTVSINEGANDNAFQLETSTTGGIVIVRNEIKDFKNLPHRITIQNGTEKITFRDKAEFSKYQQEHGATFTRMSDGIVMEIQLEVKVPVNMITHIESIYGMVEVTDFSGPLTVESTYGGVDAALTEKLTGELVAETNYGEILTNLDSKFSSDKETDKDFYTYVKALPGIGPRYSFVSKYGNVYLRKSK